MNQNFLSARSIIPAATRPADVADYLARHVLSGELRVSAAATDGAQLRHRRLAPLEFCQTSFATEARLSGRAPHDTCLLQIVVAGTCRQEGDPDSPTLAAGDLVVSKPREPFDLACAADCELLLVSLPASLFAEVCLEHGWTNGQYSSFPAGARPCSEVPNLESLLTLLCQEAEDGTTPPQMLQHYARTLACKLLTGLVDNLAGDRSDQQGDCYRRLVDYIEQNIRDEISVEALARHANISPRSLYLLFEKHANTTPRNFIRQKKLEKVYATLMDPARNIINVTAVALDYGFTHLGRFSELYRSTYGVLPSAAVRSRLPGKAARPRRTK